MFAEAGEVVLVSSADLFDQSVEAEAIEKPGNLPVDFVGQQPAQSFILHFQMSVNKSGCVRETAPVEPGLRSCVR